MDSVFAFVARELFNVTRSRALLQKLNAYETKYVRNANLDHSIVYSIGEQKQ